MNWLYLKHRLVGTPFQRPAQTLRWVMQAPRRRRHPELCDLYLEDKRAHQVMKKLVSRDSNCIDIGSHIGSVLAELHTLAPGGRHFAFEPIPTKAKWLTQKFPNTRVFQVALSDREGQVTFSQNITHPGFSGLARAKQRPNDRWEELNVRCVKLDDMIPEDVDIDFIKIDVEGAEVMALRGAEALIARCRPGIIFESAPQGAKAFDMTHRDIFDLLTQRMGYSIYFFKDFLSGQGPTDWERFDQAHHYPFSAFNFLALPAARGHRTDKAGPQTRSQEIAVPMERTRT